MKKQYFGTDGIRGRVGESTINPEFVLKLGWAVGRVLAASGERKRVVIGKDTRVSGYMLESALEAGLSAAGVDVLLTGPMPTPAVAYLTQTFRAQAGVVISASHNPFDDNGIKFFAANGTKLDDALELAIEAQIDQPLKTVDSSCLGKAVRIDDAAGRYIEFCKSTIPFTIRLHGLKIVLDCANGATYHIAPNVFRELGAEVVQLSVNPDGFNINRDCGSTHPKALAQAVLREKAHVGIAFDGDGDRVIMVDEHGQLVDGDELVYIIAKHRSARNKLRGGVVGTQLSNLGLELAIKRLGSDFKRTHVGDRYVLECLYENKWFLGGETSGHIICRDKTSTGDGIVSALQVLAAAKYFKMPLSEILQDFEKLPQTMINVKTTQAKSLMTHPKVSAAMHELQTRLAGRGRVLLRPSGTEPVLRVMVEGQIEAEVNDCAQELANCVAKYAG